MKKLFKFSGFVVAIFFLCCGSAMAITYTYSDIPPNFTDSWPGYTPYGGDNIGHPSISSMAVTINDSTRDLESVLLNMADRLVPDSLFINTGGDGLPYEAWDFFVRDLDLSDAGATLYTVASSYTYELTTYPHRPGHPVGFISGITPDGLVMLASVVGTPSTLTYTFNPGIHMFSDFVIGYDQFCANEVIITSPVPEPISLLLLGLGLVGLVGVSRKLKKEA